MTNSADPPIDYPNAPPLPQPPRGTILLLKAPPFPPVWGGVSLSVAPWSLYLTYIPFLLFLLPALSIHLNLGKGREMSFLQVILKPMPTYITWETRYRAQKTCVRQDWGSCGPPPSPGAGHPEGSLMAGSTAGEAVTV